MEVHVSVIATRSFRLRAAAAAPVAAALVLGLASAHEPTGPSRTVRPTGVAAGQGLVEFSAYDPSIDASRLMISRGGSVQRERRPESDPLRRRRMPNRERARICRVLALRRPLRARAARVRHLCVRPGLGPREPLRRVESDRERCASDVLAGPRRVRLLLRVERRSAAHGYTRAARPSRPSQRLPGLPSRRCLVRGGCGEVTGTVDELELYGDHLAETVHTVTYAHFDRRQTEVRLVGVHSESSAQVAARGVGEGGQAFIGPAFAAGRLYTYFTCQGDPGGCLNGIGGYYRYRYGTGDWAKQATSTQLAGFAVSNLGRSSSRPRQPAAAHPRRPRRPAASSSRSRSRRTGRSTGRHALPHETRAGPHDGAVRPVDTGRDAASPVGHAALTRWWQCPAGPSAPAGARFRRRRRTCSATARR